MCECYKQQALSNIADKDAELYKVSEYTQDWTSLSSEETFENTWSAFNCYLLSGSKVIIYFINGCWYDSNNNLISY